MKGSAVETVGNLPGSQDWAQSGKQEHAQGEAEYNAAQAKGYVEGTKDRIGGRKDAVVGAVTGDRQQEAQGACRGSVWHPRGIYSRQVCDAGNVRRDKGEMQQDFNRSS